MTVTAAPAGRRSLLARNAAASAARALAGGLTGIALPVVLAALLAPRDYAAWAVVWSLAAYTQYLDLGGLSSVAALVARREARGDRAGAAQVGFAGMRLTAAISVACLIAAAAAGTRLPDLFPGTAAIGPAAAGALVVLVAGQCAGLVGAAAGSYFTGLQRTAVATAVLVPGRVLAFALTIAAAAAGAALPVVAAAFAVPLAASATSTGLLVAASARRSGPRADRVPIGVIARFAGPLAAWSVGMLLVSGIDVTVVGVLDYRSVGAYAVAAALVTGVVGLANALLGPVLPELARRSESLDGTGFERLLLSGSRLNSAVLGGVGAAVVAGSAVLLPLVVPGQAHTAVPLVVLLTIANVLRSTTAPLASSTVARGVHRRVILPCVLEVVVNVAASIALGALLGATGVALGTLIGAVVGVAAMTGTAGRVLETRPGFIADLGRAVLLGSAVVAPAVVGATVVVLTAASSPARAVVAAALSAALQALLLVTLMRRARRVVR